MAHYRNYQIEHISQPSISPRSGSYMATLLTDSDGVWIVAAFERNAPQFNDIATISLPVAVTLDNSEDFHRLLFTRLSIDLTLQ